MLESNRLTSIKGFTFTRQDLPQLARILYRECERVRVGGLQVTWSPEAAGVFLGTIWENPAYHVEVERTGDTITAVCGVNLFSTLLPPHPLTMSEWLWWGDNKKATVRVWNRCKLWAKAQGAQYAICVLAKPQVHPRKFIETYQWVKL